MKIEQMTSDRYPECVSVIRKSFFTVASEFGITEQNFPNHTSFMTLGKLSGKIENGALPFGYIENGIIKGYVSINNLGNDTWELNNLAVLPEYRHSGIGRELVDFCKDKVVALGGEKIMISIIDENTRLRIWYEANDFNYTGMKVFVGMPFTVGYMDWTAEGLRLVLPSAREKAAVDKYKQEFINAGETTIHGGGGLMRSDTYEDWLENINKPVDPDNTDQVPADTYIAVSCGRAIGTIQIRHKLNDRLLAYGGNIGYSVAPGERLRGYATSMLSKALAKCRRLGIERALVTCDKDNFASAKTIQKCGGVLENEVPQDDGKILQRYWIKTGGM